MSSPYDIKSWKDIIRRMYPELDEFSIDELAYGYQQSWYRRTFEQ